MVVPHDTSVALTGQHCSGTRSGNGRRAVAFQVSAPQPDQYAGHEYSHASARLLASGRATQRGKRPGSASFLITVAAPGAMPVWLAWLIAVVPMPLIAWLVWHQYRYRRRLLVQAKS